MNPSPFSPSTTAASLVGNRDLSGRVFFITGGNSGIGLETVRVLFNAGATVIIASRSIARVEAAIASLRSERPPSASRDGTLLSLDLDLSKQRSVHSCVDSFRELGIPTIDTLFCNAGIADPPYSLSEDGFELSFAINHYGHFTLTLLLLPFISRRIVYVSSGGHWRATFRIEDLPTLSPETYNGWTVYGDTKLANILITKHLQALLHQRGSQIRVYSLHPGTVPTGLAKSEFLRNLVSGVAKRERETQSKIFKTMGEAAATSVYASLAEEIGSGRGGEYLVDCAVGNESDAAQDRSFARDLFEQTEKLTGVSFGDIDVRTTESN